MSFLMLNHKGGGRTIRPHSTGSDDEGDGDGDGNGRGSGTGEEVEKDYSRLHTTRPSLSISPLLASHTQTLSSTSRKASSVTAAQSTAQGLVPHPPPAASVDSNAIASGEIHDITIAIKPNY